MNIVSLSFHTVAVTWLFHCLFIAEETEPRLGLSTNRFLVLTHPSALSSSTFPPLFSPPYPSSSLPTLLLHTLSLLFPLLHVGKNYPI